MEEKILLYKTGAIHYHITGKGQPLVLLHGYLADSRVWNKIIPLLKSNFQLIIPDLPGHGKTKTFRNVNTMEFLAEIVYKLCLSMGINNLKLAGHSMGGFIALAFAEKYFSMIDGLYLINSHPFADNLTRTLARNREAEIIKSGKKHLLLLSFVDKNFFPGNLTGLTDDIRALTQISYDQPDSGILADLAGMMARPDRSHVVKQTRYPVHFIAGMNDEKVPGNLLRTLPGNRIHTHILEKCGHFCFVEKTEQTADIILSKQNE